MMNFKGSGRGLIEVLSQHLPGEAEENDENPVRITGVPTEIRTDHLHSISLFGLYSIDVRN
jgi:hypothetical protein